MEVINESLAKRAKENMSFSRYENGSATSEYNAVMQDAKEKIEAAKEKVSDEGKERLDKLFERYASTYAAWINRYNANGSKHVSQMICGAGNYNMRSHEKYLDREGKLWKEYDEIKDISRKIHAIVAGDKIIKSDDADAIEKLRAKLAKAQEEHEGYKNHNAEARKTGGKVLPAYVLQNSNGRIKGIKDRIAYLERIAKKAAETPISDLETVINGVKIFDNLEAQRLQIFFSDKPSAEVRAELKRNGFRWSPSSGAWQSYRTYNAKDKASAIISKL